MKDCRKLSAETSTKGGKSGGKMATSMKGKGKDKGKTKDKGKGKGKRLGLIEDSENEGTWEIELLMMVNELEDLNYQVKLKIEQILFIIDCGAEVHAIPLNLALFFGAEIKESSTTWY